MKKLFSCLLALALACGSWAACAEMVRVESADGIALSAAPVEQWPGAMLRVAFDEEILAEKQGCLEATVTLPYIPPNLYTVILSDGQSMIHGYFEILGPGTILVGFPAEEIRKFQCVQFCYLVFVTALRDLR